MLANLLGSGQLAVEDDQVQVSADGPAGNLHHHAFVNGRGHHIFIVWNRTDSQHVTAAFARRFRVAVEYEIDGRRKRAPAGSRMDLQLAAGVPRVFELTE